MIQKRKAVVVDFDGTFVDCNSFEQCYKKLCFYYIRRFNIGNCIILIYWLILRKLRIIKHCQLKYKFMYRFSSKKSFDRFIDLYFIPFLYSHINSSVLKLIREYKELEYYVLLSTAAPITYIYPFVKRGWFTIDGINATPIISNHTSWIENIGLEKEKSTLSFLLLKNLDLSVLITDHFDDIPLLLISKEENIIVSPTEKTLQELKKANISYRILH